MTIQGVSFGQQGAQITSNDLEQYDRQIKVLQQKIKDTQRNDRMDDEQKEQLIQLYSQEIASLQAEKAQKAQEQALQRQERASAAKQEKQPEVQEEDNTGIIPIDESVQKGFIQAQTALDEEQAEQVLEGSGTGRMEPGQFLDDEA